MECNKVWGWQIERNVSIGCIDSIRRLQIIIFHFKQHPMSLKTEQVLKYINLARQYPKYYLNLIDQHLNSFIDDINIKLSHDIIYQTIEGKTVWQNAREFINHQQPLRPFLLHEGLVKAAGDHVRDIIKNVSTGHQGSDGSNFIDRIQRYCKKGKGNMIELIGATHVISGKNSIQLALLNLIIDDGVANRGHRRALFSKEYKYIGMVFIEREDKIYSVISMAQSNLEILKHEPQNIATSTSHLKTVTEINGFADQSSNIRHKVKEHSIIDAQIRANKVQTNHNTSEQVWTLRNVVSDAKSPNKRPVQSKQIQQVQAEPSIFKEVQDLAESNHFINTSLLSNPFACPSNEGSMMCFDGGSSKQPFSSKPPLKDNSLKNSQHSINSEIKQFSSLGFGTSSTVQNFKIKSSLGSPFYKSPAKSSGYASLSGKRVVEKKEMKKTWNQDEFLVKQVVTIVKYDDGTVEDFVEKHSILKSKA